MKPLVKEISDGPDGVVFAKNNGNWETRGTAAGALIGSVWARRAR
jgi:hypothetical protein